MKLLLIEDEEQIAAPLKKALEKQGYALDWYESGREGYEAAFLNDYDCILLDLNLPEMDGLDIAARLREKNVETPILMLTARSQQEDKIKGFKGGADDYLVKPFHFTELLYRIKALIKRSSRNKKEILTSREIRLIPESRKVFVENREIRMKGKEYGVLEYLLRNKGRIVSQEELLEHVWDSEVDFFTQTVKTYIKMIRKKIDPQKKIIKTVRGAGYIIE